MTVAIQGGFGKPRPALVIQSDHFDAAATITIMLISRTLVDAPLLRMTVEPTKRNGLQKPSQIMVDKIMTVRRDKIGEPFGHLDPSEMVALDRLLAVFLGIA